MIIFKAQDKTIGIDILREGETVLDLVTKHTMPEGVTHVINAYNIHERNKPEQFDTGKDLSIFNTHSEDYVNYIEFFDKQFAGHTNAKEYFNGNRPIWFVFEMDGQQLFLKCLPPSKERVIGQIYETFKLLSDIIYLIETNAKKLEDFNRQVFANKYPDGYFSKVLSSIKLSILYNTSIEDLTFDNDIYLFDKEQGKLIRNTNEFCDILDECDIEEYCHRYTRGILNPADIAEILQYIQEYNSWAKLYTTCEAGRVAVKYVDVEFCFDTRTGDVWAIGFRNCTGGGKSARKEYRFSDNDGSGKSLKERVYKFLNEIKPIK